MAQTKKYTSHCLRVLLLLLAMSGGCEGDDSADIDEPLWDRCAWEHLDCGALAQMRADVSQRLAAAPRDDRAPFANCLGHVVSEQHARPDGCGLDLCNDICEVNPAQTSADCTSEGRPYSRQECQDACAPEYCRPQCEFDLCVWACEQEIALHTEQVGRTYIVDAVRIATPGDGWSCRGCEPGDAAFCEAVWCCEFYD